jgi:ABC-type branched-subunit amino acid transport system substrate-binding protein
MEKAGLDVAISEGFAPKENEFLTLLNKVKAKNPVGILLIAETELAVPFLKQVREVMPNIKIMETGGSIPEELLKLAPKESDGVITLSRAGEETAEIQAFKDLLSKNRTNTKQTRLVTQVMTESTLLLMPCKKLVLLPIRKKLIKRFEMRSTQV